MSLVGIHVSNILDIPKEIDKHTEFKNINLIQIFVSATTNYSDEKFSDILNYVKLNRIYLVVHASYSINISRRWSDKDWWIQQFIGEIDGAAKLGSFGIVIHTGKKLDLSNSEAINNMYTAFLYIHHKTSKHQKVRIMLETPSGQGTETLTNIEDFCRFMKKFYDHPDHKIRDRFGICVDTCHIFAAGYDIRGEQNMNKFFKTINDLIGTDKIKLCQINDSKKGVGSKLDRHQTIGKGEIGKESILRIVKFMKSLEIPIVLETPINGLASDYKLLVNN
jgi:deoxyribonuclease-4